MAKIVLANCNALTMDELRPKASCIEIDKGLVLGLGDRGQIITPRRTDIEVIDCKGKTVLPGFIDSHLHLVAFAESLVTLNLRPESGVTSIADIQSKIEDLAKNQPEGSWIRGKGYDEFCLAEKRHPNRWDLDKAAPFHPVKLTHRSGHAHVLNSLALKLVEIHENTEDPPKGMIERDLDVGAPTGLLYEMGDVLCRRIPAISEDDLTRGISMANKAFVSQGITSVQDASNRNDKRVWDMVRSWKDKKLLSPRVNLMFGVDGFMEGRPLEFPEPSNPRQLRLSGVKVILDETTGCLLPSQQELDEIVFEVHKSGLQVALHALEENAVASACSAVESALKRFFRQDHRHRIEHCSICPPSLAKRMASLGIRVVTQPSFIYFNGDRYLDTVPSPRLPHLYPLKSLIKSGLYVAGSSDCPICPLNPLIAIYSAVCRESQKGRALNLSERISIIEALRMYTTRGAAVTFENELKGTITVGKVADLVMLNEDPTRIPFYEIKDLEVEMTILDGDIVWSPGT